MTVSKLLEIENQIRQLSLSDQLWLVERLIQHIRTDTAPDNTLVEIELADMAADPEIQAELQQIETEFAVTEMDGLPDLEIR
jgi:hypothetical protein